jgi:hypothetical protein
MGLYFRIPPTEIVSPNHVNRKARATSLFLLCACSRTVRTGSRHFWTIRQKPCCIPV